MNERHTPAAAVLCGGAGRRMGRDKAMLVFEGATLLARAVRRVRGVCDPVILARGTATHRVPGCIVVADAPGGSGPLAGLVAALHASPAELVAAVAVDMPWLDPHLLRLLAARIDAHDAAVPLTEHGAEPLHAVYRRSAVAECERVLTGSDHSMRAALAALDTVYVSEDEWRAAGIVPGFARNLNSPEDLAALR